MTDGFYQISIIISGRLLDFEVEDTNFNKYKTGTGKLLVYTEQTVQLFPITAGKELVEQLTKLIGSYVEITGAVRNYRCNEEKYNVIRAYSIEEKAEDTCINSVQATCEVVGLMTKPSMQNKMNVKAAQLYLLTNEKYNKHTRLNAVIFGANDKPLNIGTLPSLGSVYAFKGYLQIDKASQKTIGLSDLGIENAVAGKLEMVVTDYTAIYQNECAE